MSLKIKWKLRECFYYQPDSRSIIKASSWYRRSTCIFNVFESFLNSELSQAVPQIQPQMTQIIKVSSRILEVQSASLKSQDMKKNKLTVEAKRQKRERRRISREDEFIKFFCIVSLWLLYEEREMNMSGPYKMKSMKN